MRETLDRSPEGGGGNPQRTAAPAPDHGPPPGARAMNVARWALLAGLVVVAALSVGGYVLSRSGAGKDRGANAAKALYHCPMHPTYTSNDPNAECPICGMDLEPVPVAGQETAEGDVPGLTGVHLSPERIQMIGVRTARAERRPLAARLELVAFVTPDESRLRRVQLRVAGWVQQLHVSRTGEEVQAGQPLLSLYSPQLYQSEREFLIELGGDSIGSGLPMGALESARERLALLDVPPDEIARLERERTATTRLTLRAPVTGTVLERGVTEGQYVGPNTPLLTLADLSRVWLLVDLYEMDFSRVRVGDRAVFTADAMPGRSFEGRVEFIYPTVSIETRTLKARISLDHPKGDLRPGMYGRVKVSPRGQAVITVPVEAVIHTGEHHYVFIALEGGHFEPRMVWVGGSEADRVEILRGLDEGETVVASASFLIDSESRLKAAIAGMGSPSQAGHQH